MRAGRRGQVEGERDRDAHRDRERCTRGGVRVTKKVFSWTFHVQISDPCVYIPEEGQGLLVQPAGELLARTDISAPLLCQPPLLSLILGGQLGPSHRA